MEVAPKILGFGFALVAAALVRDAAKFRARTRGDAAAAAAAADQLAGLDDGADDDPLLPLALTWRTVRVCFVLMVLVQVQPQCEPSTRLKPA